MMDDFTEGDHGTLDKGWLGKFCASPVPLCRWALTKTLFS
jgi:hypothetical protein